MTPEQKTAFHETGYVLLRRALHKSQVEPLKRHVLDELKRLKIWASGKTLSPSMKAAPPFQQITKLSGLINVDALHTRLIDKEMLAMITALADCRLLAAQSQLLLSLPNQGDWSIQGLSWHTDISAASQRRVPGIQAFILLDDVQAHGGATLAIAGSHRLTGHDESNRKVREMLRKKELPESELRSNKLSIVEMSGNAGDVYLMDMRTLHTPSINATGKVRMMATIRFLPAP